MASLLGIEPMARIMHSRVHDPGSDLESSC